MDKSPLILYFYTVYKTAKKPMSNTPKNAPNHHPAAGYYPAPIRVTELNKLADNITELVAHLDAGTFRLLQLICEFDENEGWEGPGIRSCAHWLNWKCGMSLGSARERVRVARALPGLPLISAAFRKGKVSYSKVRAMTRVATPENEAALLQVALHGMAWHRQPCRNPGAFVPQGQAY
jgi:hypothetical protein